MDQPKELHPGACIRLGAEGPEAGDLYQVISVDDRGGRCWLRRWPLARHGSPVFELPLPQVQHGGRPPFHSPGGGG